MEFEIKTYTASTEDCDVQFGLMKQAIWKDADIRNYRRQLSAAQFGKGEQTLVCFLGEVMVGYISYRWEIGVAYIMATGVHPDYQRRGIATALKQEMHARVKALGCHKVTTETGIGWPSQMMNFKLGYQELVRIENHYGGYPFVYAELVF